MLKVLYWIFDIFTYLLIIPIVLVAFTGHISQQYSPLIFGVAYAFLAARQILDWRVHPGQKLSKLDNFYMPPTSFCLCFTSTDSGDKCDDGAAVLQTQRHQ